MKELDKSKRYYLRYLTPLQRKELSNKIGKNILARHTGLVYKNDKWNIVLWYKRDLPTNAKELFEDEVKIIAEAPKEVFNPQQHYFNEPKQFRSLFELSHILELNDWEFDILKRLVRCRKKGQFVQDIKKIKDTADIYLNEFKEK